MKKLLLVAALSALSFAAQADVWRGIYGQAKTFDFKLYNADGTLDVDEADGGTEVSLSCDQGNETTATSDFVDEGNFYSIALTAAEMRCKNIAVIIGAPANEVFFVQTDANPGVIAEGTAQAATGTTLRLAPTESFADNQVNGATCLITSGSTGVGESRALSGYVSSTDTGTVSPWTVTPTGDFTYQCHGTASGTVAPTAAENAAATFDLATSGHTSSGTFGQLIARIPNVAAGGSGGLFIAGTNAATTITTGLTTNVTGNVSGSVGSVTGAVGSVAGNVTGSVASVGAGGINAASIATGAIDADALATDAVTELWAQACSEPSAKPSWTTSGRGDFLCWMSAWSVNKVTQSSSVKTLRNDADNAALVTCAVGDDATTFTLGECTP